MVFAQLRAIPGVGKVTEEKLANFDIHLVRDLHRHSREMLVEFLGSFGAKLHQLARGIDNRPVKTARERKSIGIERTFGRDISNVSEIEGKLLSLCEGLWRRVIERDIHGRTITLKVKYSNFQQITRSTTLKAAVSEDLIREEIFSLLSQTEVGLRPVRLLGVSLGNLGGPHPLNQKPPGQWHQLPLTPVFD